MALISSLCARSSGSFPSLAALFMLREMPGNDTKNLTTSVWPLTVATYTGDFPSLLGLLTSMPFREDNSWSIFGLPFDAAR